MKLSPSTQIGVLLGGLSKEREISLRSGKGMAEALRRKGYKNVVEIDVDHEVVHRLEKDQIEVAVLALHGRYGEDGTIQGLLEYLNIPYTGTGVLGSSVAMNKVLSKVLFDHLGVPTPSYFVASRSTEMKKVKSEVASHLGFPSIAKPVNEGSTIGLSVVKGESEIEAAQSLGLQFDEEVLWEKFIEGTELTVGFLQGRALPIVEIVPKKGLFDYEAKYTKGMTDYFCPARIPEKTAEIVKREAKKAFDAVHAESFGRVDLIWSNNTAWTLEVNTIPGMTETSLLPKAAKAEGISYDEVVETILKDARLKV